VEKVSVGTTDHQLRQKHVIDKTEMLETFDYPGGYAHHFDGVSRGGGNQEKDLERVFGAADRSARLRAELAASEALDIRGESNAGNFVPGFQFSFDRHGDADGVYLLTHVEHSAKQVISLDTSPTDGFDYENSFACLPAGMPYRPKQATPSPQIV